MIELLSIYFSSTLFKWAAICLIGIFALYKYLLSKCNHWESQGVPTASVGLFSRSKSTLHEWQIQLVQKNGKLFGIYEFMTPVLYVSHPDLIQDVLVKDFNIFSNRRDFSTGADPIVDNSLSTLSGESWKRVRSIMSPAFTTGKLRKMRPLIDECLKTLVHNLETISESVQESEMKTIFGAYSIEVILQVAFGVKVNALFDEKNPIIKNAKKMFSGNFNHKFLIRFVAPKLAKFLKIAIFDMEVTHFFEEFTLKIIDERKNSKNKVKRVDFLQLMLDAIENNSSDNSSDDEKDEKINFAANKTMSYKELTAQCVFLIVGGYETTATAISYVIYNLARNPEAQDKLYEEAKTVFSSNKEVDYDVVHSLKYLDSVIMESLRLYPPVVGVERVAGQDYILGNTGIQIKKGQIIHFPIYSIHRDPDNFPEPNSFKPERFFPENRSYHPFAYLPFGGGPRNCVGMRLALLEAKLALVQAVYRFKFSTTSKTSIPPKCYLGSGMMLPKQIFIKVDKR